MGPAAAVSGALPLTRAPWAVMPNSETGATQPLQAPLPSTQTKIPGKGETLEQASVQASAAGSELPTGSVQMRAYMALCLPDPAAGRQGSVSSEWDLAQAAASPTLLPHLKFHELVFSVGKALGTGAFSEVKYARHVTAGCSQSDWPEYAVKIISHSVLMTQQYHRAVEGEIAVLRILAHPGICRGVSWFRYSSSA